jgi:Uma2 family endonuclease
VNARALPQQKMSATEFLAWAERQAGGRFELVDGEVVAMSPERVRHTVVKLEVAVALREAIRARGLPCQVFSDGVAVVINDHRTREPDASVQCGLDVDLDALALQAPSIVVEVVSPSSERDDSGVKLIDYFSVATIEHYLVVYPDPAVRAVVHHQRVQGGVRTRVARSGEEIVLDPPGFSVAVAALLGPVSLGAAPGAEPSPNSNR